jgi:hypothetical protein
VVDNNVHEATVGCACQERRCHHKSWLTRFRKQCYLPSPFVVLLEEGVGGALDRLLNAANAIRFVVNVEEAPPALFTVLL